MERVSNVPRDKKTGILIVPGYHDRGKPTSEPDREPLDKITSFNSY